MTQDHTIDGYAIVSDNNCIADSDGNMPECLKNEADWAYFQAALDAASITVVGRKGHQANPNHRNRRRLVLSRSADALERRSDAWWWNPEQCDWNSVLSQVSPQPGAVAVPGGRDVFDMFLDEGYSSFHLARAGGTEGPDGTQLFSGLQKTTPEQLLDRYGLQPEPTRWLDRAARVSMTIWRKTI